jgi:hypothetical protein
MAMAHPFPKEENNNNNYHATNANWKENLQKVQKINHFCKHKIIRWSI